MFISTKVTNFEEKNKIIKGQKKSDKVGHR
jgi:hypothetical protein